MGDYLIAALLGLIEGLTEFIPVSSTGHLLLAKEALGLTDTRWNSFVVMIQLGAILAVIALYFGRLWAVVRTLPTQADSRRFALSVLLAFLPSAVLGLLLYDFIKQVLFESPTVICVSLIVGGAVLLALERFAPRPRHNDAMKLSWSASLGVGLCQALSMVPGVSRSGATIAGGLLLGLDKRTAAEFSFFLAIPTMTAVFVLDASENLDAFRGDFLPLLAVGFVVSFLSGAFVIRTMLDFVARHGFTPFAWWRIVVGAAGLLAVSLGAL
ncbi:MAG: undecaprenyl-diphosphate phosphatase [Proteobacteria bacterium]|nr:undecaprenyl-diphosphate phosphatase [Pseudomonadota bacterium]